MVCGFVEELGDDVVFFFLDGGGVGLFMDCVVDGFDGYFFGKCWGVCFLG